MKKFEKEFEAIIEKAKTVKTPVRVVVAGADSENILQAIFEAESEGFVHPILVGVEDKILDMLDKFGLRNRNYEICKVEAGESVVQTAIDVVNIGMGDILMRGNTATRDFLMPIIHKVNKLMKNELLSEVAILKVPEYNKLLLLSDVSILIHPSLEQRKLIIKNMVEVLHGLGIENPKVAILSLVEKPSFHMRDTVEAQTIALNHKAEPIADCEIVGPIPWDLIVSKEAARLKNYDCPYCGEFDAVLCPDVMAGNVLMKALQMSAHYSSCGVIAGAKFPIAITSRSSSVEQCYLSIASCCALLKAEGKK
ncbi:MAG: hypothetical protein J6R94_00495 [Agathobacter sp.]|nr:hypothetical protein [Agathobacter sp.]